jgi:hypothetical protein
MLKPAVTFEGRHVFVTGRVSTSNRVDQGIAAVFEISLSFAFSVFII